MDRMSDATQGSEAVPAGTIDELSDKILLVDLLHKANDEEMSAFIVFLEEIRLLQERILGGQDGLREEIRGMVRILHSDLDHTLKRQRL